MAQIRRSLSTELVEELKSRLFPIEQLRQPSEFRRLVEAEQNAHLAHKEAHETRGYPSYTQLSALDRTRREAIKGLIERILAAQDTLSKHFLSWAERVSREIAGDQDRVWRHILSATTDHVERIEALLADHGKLDVVGLSSKDLRLVQEHLDAFKKHLDAGHGLGFWIFKARPVKDAHYLVKSVTVNGKPCNNLRTLHDLAAWIEVSTRIGNLNDLWKGITTPPNGEAVLQCSAYRDLCKPIEQALALHDRIREVRKACRDCPGIHFPAWHSQEEVRAFYKALDGLNLEEDFAAAQRLFAPLADSLKEHINSGHSHASTHQLLQAVSGRDGGLYQDAFESLSSLHTWATDYTFARSIHERFHGCAPKTCESYDESYSEPAWDERLAEFDTAWIWAKTDHWLDETSDKDRPRCIQRALETSASKERDALRNLAASRAWQALHEQPPREGANGAYCLVTGGEKNPKRHGKICGNASRNCETKAGRMPKSYSCLDHAPVSSGPDDTTQKRTSLMSSLSTRRVSQGRKRCF